MSSQSNHDYDYIFNVIDYDYDYLEMNKNVIDYDYLKKTVIDCDDITIT